VTVFASADGTSPIGRAVGDTGAMTATPPEPADLLILGATVLTMDDADTVIDDGGVAVRGERIVAVGASRDLRERFEAVETITLRHAVLLPGLVDTYGHAGHGLIRGLFHPDLGWPSKTLYWHATSPDWWYAESLLSATERLRFGVTTGQTIVGSTPARLDEPVYAERVAEAYEAVGVRSVIGVGPPDPIFTHLDDPWEATRLDGGVAERRAFSYEQTIEHTNHVIERLHGRGRVRIALAPPYLLGRHVAHGRLAQRLPDDGDAATIHAHASEMRALADRHGVILHTHMFRGSVDYALRHFGRDEVERLVGPDVVVAHANGLSTTEVELLGARRVGIASVAHTHENLWYGVAPLVELLDAGATVSIATDGTAPYASYDLLREPSRATWHQWLAHGTQRVMPPGTVLRMITAEAARALGMADEIGSIVPGKRADLVVVDLDRPHLTPTTSIPVLLTQYATGHDVAIVVVDGRVVVREGRLVDVDVDEVVALARREAAAVFGREDVGAFTRWDRAFWRGSRYGDA
jgi:5-methylthioadenosine/S-adenosylhomocysteine deaminase